MQSKINIATGIKAEHILEGEGYAQRVIQENLALVESIRCISDIISEYE